MSYSIACGSVKVNQAEEDLVFDGKIMLTGANAI